MIQFYKVVPNEQGEPVEMYVREISQAAIRACPHYIMTPEHYTADGSCRCNDVSHKEMHEWGYQWDNSKQQWVTPQETDDAT
jgi:hypothetical protein